jgi:hypothetical protein
MTRLCISCALAAFVTIISGSSAQQPAAAPASAAGATANPTAKPRPFTSTETKVLLEVAESVQFQLGMAQRITGKFRETDPAMVSFAGKLRKEATELWTPMVDMATARGIDGKKIPLDMSKNDKANVAKLGAIKDEKKWTLTFFEHFAKESKRNASTAQAALKSVGDPDLKAWMEKAAAILQSQSATVDSKAAELKASKK